MALTLYTGVPGSGKSYALVEQVLIPAVRDGRTVRTNLAGVKPADVVAYVQRKWPDCDFGQVLLFDGPETLSGSFFPDPERPNLPSTMQPGELLIMDEIGLHWGQHSRGKFPAEVIKFLRLHRHMTDARTHRTTDVALATQKFTDLNLEVRGLVERNYKFKKLSTLGMAGSYAWSMWEGGSQRKGEAVQNGTGKYRSEIFALYKSHSLGDGAGLESSTDKRANVLRDPKVLVTAGGAVAAALAAIWFLASMFTGGGAEGERDQVAAVAGSAKGSSRGAGSSAVAAGPPPPSAEWRIAGSVRTATQNAVVLADRSGRLRLEGMAACHAEDGYPLSCVIDGTTVTRSAASGRPPSGAGPIFGGVGS
jgi:zona occludens toxin